MLLRDERGSALTETIISLTCVVMILVGGLFSSYMAFARVWLSRNAYEALICLASDAEIKTCEKEFRERVELALPIGKLDRVRLMRSRSRVRIRGDFYFTSNLRLQSDDTLPRKLTK